MGLLVVVSLLLNASSTNWKLAASSAFCLYRVAFVPNSNFATDMDKPTCSFRLNYSMMPEEKIEEGIRAIGAMLKEKLGE
jgi:DNA-binding transcriptional MocR family regulator